MDIDEVLKYTPTTASADSDDLELSPKRRKLNSGLPSGISSKDIEKLLNSDDGGDPVAEMDETALKRLVLQFERKVLKNQEMRIKHSDNPAKFLDSELELFDIIKEMHVIATQPSLYTVFIQLNVISTFLGLLSHENTDISCAVVGLLQELADLDDVEEIDQVGKLMDVLIDSQIIVLLVNNMDRLDEKVKEESEGIYNSLSIIENLTDYKPELSRDVQPLISWILKKLKTKPIFYLNKLYASEILSILLQNSNDNRIMIGNLHGIDILLHVISYYKRHDPVTADEEEFMENLFNCLCSALFLNSQNRELFYQGEGIELMNLILKEKRKKESNTDVRVCALKLLNHNLSTDKPDELLSRCCNKFIEILGLRVLMPLFLKPGSIIGHKRKKKQSLIDQVEEHSLAIILALLRFCKAENLKRILNKFTESNMVKTERLVELHLKYSERLLKCDSAIRVEGFDLRDATVKEELFLRRLNEGSLFTLQLVDYIIVFLSDQTDAKGEYDNKNITVKERIYKLLHMHKTEVNHVQFIKSIIKDFANEKEDSLECQQLLELGEKF